MTVDWDLPSRLSTTGSGVMTQSIYAIAKNSLTLIWLILRPLTKIEFQSSPRTEQLYCFAYLLTCSVPKSS